VGVAAIASYTARSTAASWRTAPRVVTRVCYTQTENHHRERPGILWGQGTSRETV
jgi:hypothetical protein